VVLAAQVRFDQPRLCGWAWLIADPRACQALNLGRQPGGKNQVAHALLRRQDQALRRRRSVQVDPVPQPLREICIVPKLVFWSHV
jgi:hypothetical protein